MFYMKYKHRIKIASALLPVLLLCTSGLMAQEVVKEAAGAKKTVFEDDFTDDRNGWLNSEAGNKNGLVATGIKEGYFYYTNLTGKVPYAADPESRFDFTRDFEIEIMAAVVTTPDKNMAAGVLFWGRDSLKSAAYLYFSAQGGFSMIYCPEAGKCKTERYRSSAFVPDKPNKITVRKSGGQYTIFVNDQQEKSFPYAALKGAIPGLGAGVGTTMRYDYIRIAYLD
jgi:hypothetical protein